MASYRNITAKLWTDAKVTDNFTWEEKYFFLYLITNPHTNICGCYEISNRDISNETGLDRENVERLLERLYTVHEVIKYNPITKEVLVVNFGKYNWSGSPNLVKSVINVASHIKDSSFREFVYSKLEERFPDKNIRQYTDNSIQITDNRLQTVYTDAKKPSVYPMHTVSKSNGFSIQGRNNNYNALERALIEK